MKYKPGDKVRIKSLDWYNTHKDGFGLIFCNHICFDEKMSKFCEKTVTIAAQRNEKFYFITEDNCLSFWSEDMIEGLADEPQDKMVSLEDVCMWLSANKDNYIVDIEGETVVDDAIVEDIRKAMEE